MCKNFIKSLKDVTEVLGKERMAKALEGMTANELLDLIMQDKPLFSKDSEMSEKMRKVVEARWAKKRESTTTDTKVDTNVYDENTNKISVSYENDTRDPYENSIQKVDTNNVYEEPVQKEDTKPVVQTTPTASYSELQSQLSKFEAAAEDVMNTNDPFTIKAFRTKLDAWYKGAGAGAVEFIGDVNFITQQLVAKLAELTEKAQNNEQH